MVRYLSTEIQEEEEEEEEKEVKEN